MSRFTQATAAAGIALLGAAPAWAQQESRASAPQAGDVTCMDVPEPVVSLAYGSRYTDDSADRSDLDDRVEVLLCM